MRDLNFSSPEVSVAVTKTLFPSILNDLEKRLKFIVISEFSKISLKYQLKRQVFPVALLPITANSNLKSND